MIMALNWPTLEQRRYNSRLIMFHKLFRTNSSVNIPPHYSLLASTYNTHQFHPLHFTVLWSSTLYYQMSFLPKTIREWNKLPQRVIESDSINEFSDYFLLTIKVGPILILHYANYVCFLLYVCCKSVCCFGAELPGIPSAL